MPTTYPTIPSGMTSGVTTISATQDPRNFNYETYDWTSIQNIIDFTQLEINDIPRIIGNGLTLTIVKRALFLNKIRPNRKLRGRDFT